jgi:predicted signal transduction protein with EAL and GGDEF domain
VAATASPLRVTLSLGVAAFPADATSAITLIHEADVAVLQAKLWGRNRVVRSEDVPAALFEAGALRLSHAVPEERLTLPFDLPFAPRPDRTTL